MRVHGFQHAPLEDRGSLRDGLNDCGSEVRYPLFHAGDPLPVLHRNDLR